MRKVPGQTDEAVLAKSQRVDVDAAAQAQLLRGLVRKGTGKAHAANNAVPQLLWPLHLLQGAAKCKEDASIINRSTPAGLARPIV